MRITVRTTNEAGIDREAADALSVVAMLQGLAEAMQRLGMTKEQAIERVPLALAQVWDGLPTPSQAQAGREGEGA